jgi:hypothetical protein
MPQFSTGVRNAINNAVVATIGSSAVMKILTGTAPANCGTADSGNVLATLTLPSTWMNAASGGVSALAGTWTDASADSTGTAGYYRIYASGGTTCGWQGSISAQGGSGELQLSSMTLTSGNPFSITSFTLTAPGA